MSPEPHIDCAAWSAQVKAHVEETELRYKRTRLYDLYRQVFVEDTTFV